VSEIIKLYGSSADKENIAPQHEIGRTLKKIFPSANRHKVRVDGKRTYVYKDIAIRQLTPGKELTLLAFQDLNNFQPGYGFSLGVCCDSFCEWHCTIPDKWNGQRVVKEVKIYKSFEIEIRVAGCIVDLSSLGIHEIQKTREFLSTIFYSTSVAEMCKGFQVRSEKDSLDVKGRVHGKCGEWSKTSEENVSEMRHKAVECKGIISLGSKSAVCKNCWHIKNNCGKKLMSPEIREDNLKPKSTTSRKRKSFMSKEELMFELRDEKRKRVNVERRESYLREKIKREMLEFVEEDHNDFTKIFQSIPEENIPHDMKLLWQEQAKAVGATSSTSRRWHPK
jgi:hypothetical protein